MRVLRNATFLLTLPKSTWIDPTLYILELPHLPISVAVQRKYSTALLHTKYSPNTKSYHFLGNTSENTIESVSAPIIIAKDKNIGI